MVILLYKITKGVTLHMWIGVVAGIISRKEGGGLMRGGDLIV